MTKKMVPEADKHPKQDFQVERLAFFSDAVFAIAITLLIIEFKIPHVTKDSTYESVWVQIVALKYSLFALLMSFVLISSYWMRHHWLFKYISNYNTKLVIANKFVLLPIIFFPFTTAFFAESIENEQVVRLGLRLFLINHIVANAALYFFYWIAFVKHDFLTTEIDKSEQMKFKIQTLYPGILFCMVLLISFFVANIQIIYWILIVAVLGKRIISSTVKPKRVGQKKAVDKQPEAVSDDEVG